MGHWVQGHHALNLMTPGSSAAERSSSARDKWWQLSHLQQPNSVSHYFYGHVIAPKTKEFEHLLLGC